jgi:hypothetical protein
MREKLMGIENWELRIENSTFYILHSKFSFCSAAGSGPRPVPCLTCSGYEQYAGFCDAGRFMVPSGHMPRRAAIPNPHEAEPCRPILQALRCVQAAAVRLRMLFVVSEG